MASTAELDALIEEITVDAYNEEEQLSGFECAFDEIELPVGGTVVGEVVRVVSIGLHSDDRWLTAVCERGGRQYRVALHDVAIDAEPPLADLLAAYRRWLRP